MSPETVAEPRPSDTALAVSIVVNVEEGAEMNPRDGDKGAEPVDEMGLALKSDRRNLGNESNYRYGLDEGLDRVVRAFDEVGAPATWTCAAVALERAPRVAQVIRDRGDEAASHGYRWIHQYRMSEAEERDFVVAARDSLERTVGERPVGHLSRYLFTERTRELLLREGFEYHMDDYSRDEPFWDQTPAGPIVVLPYAIDTNDMKMWANAAYSPAMWLEYAIDTFDELYRERSAGHRMMSLGLHLRIIGRPGRIQALRRFLDHVRSHDDVWLARRRDLARAFATDHPAP